MNSGLMEYLIKLNVHNDIKGRQFGNYTHTPWAIKSRHMDT